MSEDKNNKEQRAATQTVAKALDDAIGDDDPVEHETAILARDQDGGHLGRPLTPTSSKTDTNATKSPFGPHYGDSYWTPPRKREAAGDEDPTREHVNAPKKGKSAPDASPGLQTPKRDDAPSKQSVRDGSPPPAPVEAEVDGRAHSDNEGARKDDAIDPIVDPAGEDTDVEDVAHQDWRSPDDPFEKDDMVFVKFNYGHAWYAGSIYKRYPSGDDGDFVYEVYTYMNEIFKKVPKSRLLLFTKEEFECMYSRHAGHTLCLFYAAREFNCDCAPEDWIDLKRPGLRELQELNVPDKLINRVCSTPWCKDLVKRFEAALLKRRESVEGTRP